VFLVTLRVAVQLRSVVGRRCAYVEQSGLE